MPRLVGRDGELAVLAGGQFGKRKFGSDRKSGQADLPTVNRGAFALK